MKSTVADLTLILTAILWGSGFVFSQYAIDSNMSASLILLTRFSIASIILFIAFYKKIKTITKEEMKYGLIAGAILFIAFYSQTIGLKYTTPSNNAFITATYVIMVPFITMFIFKKKPKLKFFILPLFTFLGVTILSYSPENGISLSKGDSLTLLCAFFFALHIAYLDIVSKKVDVIKMTFLQMIGATIFAFFVFGAFEGFEVTITDYKLGILSTLYLGVVCTCVCYFIQTFSQRHTSSAKAAMILSTESLFGSLFSVLFRIEDYTTNLLLGGLLILTTIFLSEMDLTRFSKTKKQDKNIRVEDFS
ncbi:MAG: DMT family transporter [Pleomorphochaeta sp.]